MEISERGFIPREKFPHFALQVDSHQVAASEENGGGRRPHHPRGGKRARVVCGLEGPRRCQRFPWGGNTRIGSLRPQRSMQDFGF